MFLKDVQQFGEMLEPEAWQQVQELSMKPEIAHRALDDAKAIKHLHSLIAERFTGPRCDHDCGICHTGCMDEDVRCGPGCQVLVDLEIVPGSAAIGVRPLSQAEREEWAYGTSANNDYETVHSDGMMQ